MPLRPPKVTSEYIQTEEQIFHHWGNCFDAPVVTFFCLTFNHQEFIEDTLKGFLMQKTRYRFEILIHDDASTDATQKILTRYQRDYPRIIRLVLQEKNQYSQYGIAVLRPLFNLAEGKYIAICEGDDYWRDPLKIDKQVAFLENNPEYVITYANCIAVSKDGKLERKTGGALRDLSAEELIRGTAIKTLTVCFRNVLKELPRDLVGAGFGDITMWSLLGAHGKGKFLPNIEPSCYRIHEGGVYSGSSQRQRYKLHVTTQFCLFVHYWTKGDLKHSLYFGTNTIKAMIRAYAREIINSWRIS